MTPSQQYNHLREDGVPLELQYSLTFQLLHVANIQSICTNALSRDSRDEVGFVRSSGWDDVRCELQLMK